MSQIREAFFSYRRLFYQAWIASLLTILATTLTACGGATPSASSKSHATHGPVLSVAHLTQYPYAVVDDPHTRRIFVLNGRSLNATGNDGYMLNLSSISVLDAATGALVHSVSLRGTVLLSKTNQAVTVDASTGQVWLATNQSNGRGQVMALDGTTGRHMRTIPLKASAWAVAVDPHARHLFVADDARVHILDAVTGTLLTVIPGGGPRFQVVVDARHKRVCLLSGNDDVVLSELTNAVLANVAVPTHEAADAFVVDPHVGHILVHLASDNLSADQLCVIMLTTGRVLHCTDSIGGSLMVVDTVTHRAFAVSTPHGSSEGAVTVDVLDTRSGHRPRIDTLMQAASESVAVSLAVDERRGRIFALSEDPSPTANGYARLAVLNTRTGQIVRTIHLPSGTWEASPAIAEDERAGHVIVANTIKRTITVLDAARL